MSSTRRRERRRHRGGDGRAARFFADVQEAVGAPHRSPGASPRCALCDSPRVKYCGLWYPTEAVQARLLVPTGKQRIIGYGLCEGCYRLPDAGRRVEEEILADFAELATSPSRN